MAIQVMPRPPGAVYWCGEEPTSCGYCRCRIGSTFIDGRTQLGPWMPLHPRCHAAVGVGLGTGNGQRYERQTDGRWLKVAG